MRLKRQKPSVHGLTSIRLRSSCCSTVLKQRILRSNAPTPNTREAQKPRAKQQYAARFGSGGDYVAENLEWLGSNGKIASICSLKCG